MVKQFLELKKKENKVLDVIYDYFAAQEAAENYFGIANKASLKSLKLKAKSSSKFTLVKLSFNYTVMLLKDKELTSSIEKTLKEEHGIDTVVTLYESTEETTNSAFYLQVWYK